MNFTSVTVHHWNQQNTPGSHASTRSAWELSGWFFKKWKGRKEMPRSIGVSYPFIHTTLSWTISKVICTRCCGENRDQNSLPSLPRFERFFHSGEVSGEVFNHPGFWRWHPDPHDFLWFEDLIPSDIKLRKSTQATKKNSCHPTSRDTLIAHFFPLLLWSNAAFKPSQNWSCLEIHHHRHSFKNTSQNTSWMSQSKLRRWEPQPQRFFPM